MTITQHFYWILATLLTLIVFANTDKVTKPYFERRTNEKAEIIVKHAQWWVVVTAFPIKFKVQLKYNGVNNQADFYKNKTVNLFYMNFTRKIDYIKTKKEVLKPDSNGDMIFEIKDQQFVRLEYNCNDCGEPRKLVFKNILFAKYDYFNGKTFPLVKYSDGQLHFKPNCSLEPEKYLHLAKIIFNDKNIALKDFENKIGKTIGTFKLDKDFVISNVKNPNGKLTCVYSHPYYIAELHQNYQYYKNITLPSVEYLYDQLYFSANCSVKKDNLTLLNTIIFNSKSIKVEGLSSAAINSKENLMLGENVIIYKDKNPEGKLVCIYKSRLEEIQISQEYVSIRNIWLPFVKYSYGELGYNANCSLNPNNHTHLQTIAFNNDKTKVGNIKHLIVQERKIFKLKEKFVVVKDRNPNGTLVCLYNVSSGEVSLSQKFETFEIKSEQKKVKREQVMMKIQQNSANKIGIFLNIIFCFIIIINIFIQ
uniref:DOMON domain-containing protein n=1 Tax=Strongyloides papillosus TaxID=174720 RepID=A0A0N5BMK2_STREA